MEDCETCKEHSGVLKSIIQLEEATLRQDGDIRTMHTKLNMIIGAIMLSPFIWQLLTGALKLGG